jgi:peroxiredoxin Q/BCP
LARGGWCGKVVRVNGHAQIVPKSGALRGVAGLCADKKGARGHPLVQTRRTVHNSTTMIKGLAMSATSLHLQRSQRIFQRHPFWSIPHGVFAQARTLLLAALAALVCAVSPLAQAALQVGDTAPHFTTEAAVAGKAFRFDMAAALRKGPVVLFFFPKAFSQGCTLEAHAFAEATPQFQALGGQVVGMSHDDIDTLRRFSSEACRDQFAVASDPHAQTIRAYDAGAGANPQRANRISYVVASNGKIAFVHQGADPLEHVSQTLKAVERIKAGDQLTRKDRQ